MCVELLINRKPQHESFKSLSSIEILCITESIKNANLVRGEKIGEFLNELDISFEVLECPDARVRIDVIGKGRWAILDYLNSIDMEFINSKVILFLDSCRMAIKDSQNNDKRKIHTLINYSIESNIYA